MEEVLKSHFDLIELLIVSKSLGVSLHFDQIWNDLTLTQ